MSTFLELARDVRKYCGIQGSGPTSVVSAEGIEGFIVEAIADAYIDIQNYRDEWQWAEGVQGFNLQTGKTNYTVAEIFGVSTEPLKDYDLNSFVITVDGQKKYLQYMDREALEYFYLNTTDNDIPRNFSIERSNNSVIIQPPPKQVYAVTFRYQKNPEVLTQDTQVPRLPRAFHQLIMYSAAAKVAVHLNIPELYTSATTKANTMLGQLMRMYLPKKRMIARAIV